MFKTLIFVAVAVAFNHSNSQGRGGGGVLIISYIPGLGLFLGFKTLNFNFFWGGGRGSGG